MQACGIICEYNPFHNGHAYQITEAKRAFGLPVICVMSGDFVQRGEFALFDKKKRADWAKQAGASLVLELPFPWCAMTAEVFAAAGVEILSKSGLCDRILFGSESGDIESLTAIADAAEQIEVKSRTREIHKENRTMGYAMARQAAIEEYLTEHHLPHVKSPNDILGIEYIKAIRKGKCKLTPHCIKREGASHHSEKGVGTIASASHIRTLLREDRVDEAGAFAPEWVAQDFQLMRRKNEAADRAILCSLMLMEPDELKEYAEIGGGMEYNIIKAAKGSDTLVQFYEKIKNKSITDAKVRRATLFAFLKVKKEVMGELPLYSNILTFDAVGRQLLKDVKGNSQIILASRVADMKKSEKAFSHFRLAERAREVFEKLYDQY